MRLEGPAFFISLIKRRESERTEDREKLSSYYCHEIATPKQIIQTSTPMTGITEGVAVFNIEMLK